MSYTYIVTTQMHLDHVIRWFLFNFFIFRNQKEMLTILQI